MSRENNGAIVTHIYIAKTNIAGSLLVHCS